MKCKRCCVRLNLEAAEERLKGAREWYEQMQAEWMKYDVVKHPNGRRGARHG